MSEKGADRMNVQEFQEKLKEIQSLARRRGNSLTAEQIRETFGDAGLDKTQLAGVLKFLASQGIAIEGAEIGAGEEKREERKRVPLTGDEKEYLKNYLQNLPDIGEVDEEALFRQAANGDREAAGQLAAQYMKAAAELAAEMKVEEIFLPDLIQEANLCLLQALNNTGNQTRDGKWLLDQVRRGLDAVCQEHQQQKFADDSLVARVEKLEKAVRELSDDEEDGESAFSINELAIILDMDAEEIRDTLRLTGDDK